MAQTAGGAQWTEPEKSVRVAALARWGVHYDAGTDEYRFAVGEGSAAFEKQAGGEFLLTGAPGAEQKARLAKQGDTITVYGI